MDYSKTTNLDPDSVIKESLVLFDLEREMISSQYFSAAAVCAAAGTPAAFDVSRNFLESGMQIQSPWTAKKKVVETKKSKEEQLMELYNKLVAKDKGKPNGSVPLVTI